MVSFPVRPLADFSVRTLRRGGIRQCGGTHVPQGHVPSSACEDQGARLSAALCIEHKVDAAPEGRLALKVDLTSGQRLAVTSGERVYARLSARERAHERTPECV